MTGNKSIVLAAKTNPLSYTIEDRPIPTAGPGSVVVKILASALLQYHKELLTGVRPYPTPLPFVPGGSAIGRIHAIGPDTTAFAAGDLVLVEPIIEARDDPAAQFLLGSIQGPSAGAAKLMQGPWRDGVLAQYAAAPLENVFALDEARLCGDLGYDILDLHLIQTSMVPYAALADAGVRAGDIVVVGPATGRFGGSAVNTALAMGARVVATGRRQAALDDLARAFGNPKELTTVAMVGDAASDTVALEKAVGPRGADVFVDFCPPDAGTGGVTPSHLVAGINVLRRGGSCVFAGGIYGGVTVPYWDTVFKNLVVRGRFMYEREHTVQVLKLVESGRLKVGKKVGMEIAGVYGLDGFEKAVDEAAGLPGWGKTVLIVP
jgi:threonine dehydrogenase-like Zn-dependent dehydrogenase